MPQVCQVCQHRHVALIDDALVKGVRYRTIADEYGVSESSLKRHKKDHVPETIKLAHEYGLAKRGASLVEEQERLFHRLNKKLDDLEEGDNAFAYIAAMRELRGQIRNTAELRGELDTSTHLHLHAHPEFLELRAVIIGALDKYPAARNEVARALESLEVAGANSAD